MNMIPSFRFLTDKKTRRCWYLAPPLIHNDAWILKIDLILV